VIQEKVSNILVNFSIFLTLLRSMLVMLLSLSVLWCDIFVTGLFVSVLDTTNSYI